ncbi:hypothetical protein [Thermoactinomyces sp. DSM 45892]|uniref:hypothetical protein n=1 Tax=Thermoactinomyces sp. DSM 45892 TaxID=1882753 RepID=UPI0008961504|nr:hypothetical protein [Thermoactinomyces sp. DSM 45892]SDZ29303.1 hypothetical protein SAMN05444416_11956 [Thermoactinomyces sp. DSM 45892]
MVNDLTQLKAEAYEEVGRMLPHDTFYHFDQELTARMLVAVTCMRKGAKDLAYRLFAVNAQEGPQENANQHFAYVRSLIEMAEMDAERGRYALAEEEMAEALVQYPDSMGYMMSKVHLEVYLQYYRFQAGKHALANEELRRIIDREQNRFSSYPDRDGVALVGPGLCYAIHQLALFYAEEGKWEEACSTMRQSEKYAMETNPIMIEEAQKFLAQGQGEEAFQLLQQAYMYHE